MPQCFSGMVGSFMGHIQGGPSYMPLVYAVGGTKKGGRICTPAALRSSRSMPSGVACLGQFAHEDPTLYPLLDLMRQPSDAAIADPYPLGEQTFEFEAPDVHAAVGDTVDLLKLLPGAKLQLM